MNEKIKHLLEYTFMRKITYAVKFFTAKRVVNEASALTYNTILAIVPICAVIFAIARGFGFNIYIETWFRNLLSSQPQAADTIINFVNSYLVHANSGMILGIGLVFMLYTVVMLTRSVEQTFNEIWHVVDRKNIVRTFTDYLAIFFLTPMVIIIMSGLSIFLTSIAEQSGWERLLGPVVKCLVELIPLVLMWLCFTALYIFMPNTKVKLKNALWPGLLATIGMTILQFFYIHAQIFITNYNAIYGSFAALPLFMLWVQFSWTICLFGAELSYTNQNLEEFAYADGANAISTRYKVLLSAILVNRICCRFKEGRHPYTSIELKQETDIPLSIIRDLLSYLVKCEVLIEVVSSAKSDDVCFVPAASVENITVGFLLNRMGAQGVWDLNINLKSYMHDEESWHKLLQYQKEFIDKMNTIQLQNL